MNSELLISVQFHKNTHTHRYINTSVPHIDSYVYISDVFIWHIGIEYRRALAYKRNAEMHKAIHWRLYLVEYHRLSVFCWMKFHLCKASRSRQNCLCVSQIYLHIWHSSCVCVYGLEGWGWLCLMSYATLYTIETVGKREKKSVLFITNSHGAIHSHFFVYRICI